MTTVADAAANAQSPIAAPLAVGVGVIADQQVITFTKYVRVVLPLDGFVFWVRADQLTPSALFGAGAFNGPTFNQNPEIATGAATITVKGSLHYTSVNNQDADATYTRNKVVFTSLEEIEDLSEIAPTIAYIGEFDGTRFHFSARSSYYQQAGLHHYVGDAVYSTMDTQIIDDPGTFDTSNVIVSNSLPIFLALNKYFPVFPAYLVPDNLPPPYASIDVQPEGTMGIQAFPDFDLESSSAQLCRDRVKITLYGCRNYTAQDYLQYLFANSVDYDNFGLLNIPVVRDVRQTQVELSIIAQKKTIDLEISYYQVRVRDIAVQLITSAFCALTLENT